MSKSPQFQPYYLIKNEVIRSIMNGAQFSTVLVLLKKLGRNEVAIATNRQERRVPLGTEYR